MDYRIIIKVLVTAVVVVAISEIGKRSTAFAAVLAALPLTSLLAFIWLYLDKKENEPVAALSMGIFWMVIPSLAFFPLLSYLLRQNVSFVVSMIAAAAVTVGVYYLWFFVLGKMGVEV
jgi:uncharacterized membrane protein (GlpM family)